MHFANCETSGLWYSVEGKDWALHAGSQQGMGYDVPEVVETLGESLYKQEFITFRGSGFQI